MQPRRVHEDQLALVEAEDPADSVPRCLRFVGNDRDFLPHHHVDKRRLPDVGPAHDCHDPGAEARARAPNRAGVRQGCSSAPSGTGICASAAPAAPSGTLTPISTLGDPPAVDFLGNEPVTIEVSRLTLLGDVAQEVVQEPADRVPVTFGKLVADELVHLVDREAPVDLELAVVQMLHPRPLDVVLVRNLANEFFEDILERDQACRPAVLVHNDREVLLAGLHFAHNFGHSLAFWEELGLAHERS